MSATLANKRIAPIPSRVPPAPSAVATGVLGGAAAAATAAPAAANNGIVYNGGPILDDANGVNVYFIWYGDWTRDPLAKPVLTNFITHLGGSPYFNINTTYYSLEVGPNGKSQVKDPVVNAVHYLGSTSDAYSQGSSLSDYQVYLAVANAITGGALPADPNGVYFLLTSGDVAENSGFGSIYCAWHSSTVSNGYPAVDGVDIKFAFLGDADPLYDCIWNYQTTLSGSIGADGMASFMAHELEESVTDPDGTSWLNPNSGLFGENADMCLDIFGSAYHSGSATDPYPPNMKFKGIPYLIQQNWVNAKGGYCALSWDE